MRELLEVVRYNEMKSSLGTVDVTNFKDFEVISKNIRGHLEGGYINDIDIRVFHGEYPT
jgi:hypothetical protein